jgi:hypothetical protein
MIRSAYRANRIEEERDPMAMTPAQRMARHRAKRLGADRGGARLNIIVTATTAAKLKRLARNWGVTQAEALERLTADAERDVLAALTKKEQRAYLGD